MVHLNSFLTPHLETHKDIRHQRADDTSVHSSTTVQNFTSIGGTVAKTSVPGQKKQLPQIKYPTKSYTSVCRRKECHVTVSYYQKSKMEVSLS